MADRRFRLAALSVSAVREFMFDLTDTRYSTPTLFAAVLADETEARALAAERLAESRFHLAIEVVEDGRVRFAVMATA